MPSKPKHQPLIHKEGIADVRASLQVVGWVNDILDASARCIGKHGTRESALVLLILHKSKKQESGGEELLESYRAWNVAPRSPAVEEAVQTAVGKLLRAGLAAVGAVGGTAISKLKHQSAREVVGAVLEAGLPGLQRVRLTHSGEKIVKSIRSTIDDKLDEVAKELKGKEKRLLKRLITKSLPYPKTLNEEPEPMRKDPVSVPAGSLASPRSSSGD